jgi:hypothetical protein
MQHSALNRTETEIDLKLLDEMLTVLRRAGNADLLLEHLDSARIYLLGAMPEEYLVSLESAKDALNTVSDSSLRSALNDALTNLLAEISRYSYRDTTEPQHHSHPKSRKPAPPGAASPVWNFFSLSDTSFGVFYPTRCIVAIFQSLDSAKSAEAALLEAGFTADEVFAATGVEVLQFFEELRLWAGLWGELGSALSRALSTEATFVAKDTERARRGAGFLYVYDPLEAESSRIRELIKPFGPISVRRYTSASIETLL